MGLSRRERQEQRWKLRKEERLQQLKQAEEAESLFRKEEYKGLLGIYDKHYLLLLVIPAIILLLSIGQVGYQIYSTGDFVNKGVALKGGATITVPVDSPVDIAELDRFLSSKVPGTEVDVRSATELGVQRAVVVTIDEPGREKDLLLALEQKIPGSAAKASSETTGSALGASFFQETTKAMLFAFIFMGLVVFISFRTLAPSVMVLLAVFATITGTIAITNVMGLKYSGAGIAALLMLIGYSVDTDILLTTRVLKNKDGTVFQRMLGAAKTGLMLTFTALIAVTISLALAQNETIKEIMIIMVIGLLLDIMNTWITNTALLRYYLEKIKPARQAKKEATLARKEERRLETEATDAKEMGLELEDDSR